MNLQKKRIFILLLILSSLLGYLEWGGGNRAFLYEMERDVILKLISSPKTAIHPLTILPLFGQFLLIASLIRKTNSIKLIYWGIGLISSLLLFIFFIGLISLRWKIFMSTLPFIILSGLFYFLNRK